MGSAAVFSTVLEIKASRERNLGPAREHHNTADKLKVRACDSEARSSEFAEGDNK